EAAYQNAEPNTGAVVTFLGRLTTPAARVFLPGTDANDVFVVGPQVTADAADGTTVVVRSDKGADVITVVRAEVATTIDTGEGTYFVTIAADGGQSNVTSPVINALVFLTSPDTDLVGYTARGFTTETQGKLTATELTGVGMGPSGRVLFTSPVQLLLQLGS